MFEFYCSSEIWVHLDFVIMKIGLDFNTFELAMEPIH
jgi:hypothetical protein